MEDIIGIVFITLFIETIFWGLAYGIGCLLTPIVSFGKWVPDSLIKDVNTGKVIKHQSGFKLIERSDQIYLGSWGVAFLGFCFLISVIIVFFLQ